jgi:hypothetical protein
MESKMLLTLQKQRKMEKQLVKAIKADPPSFKKRGISGWADVITAKYMRELKKMTEPTAESDVEKAALEYAKSIGEGSELLDTLTKGI